MVIRILDNSLVNKIAAGEVVERPASVVKELIENSIDSGADDIRIEIEDAGLKKILVSDNGCGMDPEDLLLSYRRHATSKISNDEDLFNIMSLGFRGEALASIAEISNIKIWTKTKDSTFGSFAEIEAGELLKSNSCGSPDGTIIEVTDLMFNVPARKKYLKNNETEFAYILKVVTKYALIKKDISFRLVKNGKEILNSKRSNELLNKIMYVYGPNISRDLIEVNFEKDDVSINGFISKPNLTRSDKDDQSLYVNGRYVKNNIISNSIYDAYKTLLFIHRHPVFVLNIDIHPNNIDVNVHPSKELIRLKDEGHISKIVFEGISDAFKKSSLIPDADIFEISDSKALKDYPFKKDFQSNLEVKNDLESGSFRLGSGENNEGKRVDFSWQKDSSKIKEGLAIYETAKKQHENFGPFVVFGQINQSFIVANSPQGLAIIDQHAAEERVNYERFMSERKEKAIKTQSFLTPKVIELNPVQYNIAMNNKDFICSLGYEFEEFGENTIKLSAVPEIFGRMKSILFIDIINKLSEEGNGKRETEINEAIEERIIRFACRASIKAGDELTPFEMRELLRKLGECNNPFTCPHGRPTVINFSIGDLEKKFKRK